MHWKMMMMFKKLRTTGRNSLRRVFTLLLAVLLLTGLCVFAEAADAYSIKVSGFSLDFDVDTDYYLVYPDSFADCRITGYTGFKKLKVSVEQYCSYFPYRTTAYKLGDKLELGQGRAKIVLTGTLQDGTTREYLIALADPEGADYAYAKATVVTAGETVKVYSAASSSSTVLKTLVGGGRVYYLETEGDWCKIQMLNQVNKGLVGYVKKRNLRWNWQQTAMPEQYRSAIEALQKKHPNWTFTFVNVEMDYQEALEEYGAKNEQYINPLNYLTEDKIFAFLNIDTYDTTCWNDEGVAAIWVNEKAITKEEAVAYFGAASKSLKMNAYYIACRAALESGYGTSKYASGKMAGYEGYYNFYGIRCYDNNPDQGMEYAKERNWNSLFRSIVEGANWIKDQYLDQGATTPYFFRFAGFQGKSYMTDVRAPEKEASILKRAFTDPDAKAYFIIPVYENMVTFTDLDPNAWYYEEVLGAIDAGIFAGDSPTYFNVDGNITRAEFVTALSRLCGVDVGGYTCTKFVDVSEDDWFYPYVAWAAAEGMTEGTSPNEFSPDLPIAREEMSKMLGSAIEKVLGQTLSTSGAQDFTDQEKINDWAVEWIKKCSASGIFLGDENGAFNPGDYATRAEAACVFYRCYNKFVKN